MPFSYVDLLGMNATHLQDAPIAETPAHLAALLGIVWALG